MRIVAVIMIAVAPFVCSGCGTVAVTDFPNRLIGADGQRIVLEDIEEIVTDATLSDEEKRALLRDLGLEDEKLIEALLTL